MPRRPSALVALGVALLVAGVLVGVIGARRLVPTVPSLPPLSSSVTVTRATPSVLAKIQDMKRLESVTFHMERVIDLTEKQSKLFGIVQTEDAILLVAVADVRAGVDLAKLGPNDVVVNLDARTAKVIGGGPIGTTIVRERPRTTRSWPSTCPNRAR